MAGHSTANLRQVQDQAPNLGFADGEVELRMARVPLDCADCGVSYLRLAPNWRQPFGHAHKVQEEIYVLVSGSAEMKVGDELVELQPFHAVRVPPHVMRGLKGGPDGAEVIAVGAPNTGPGDGDAPDPNWTWDH